jgi:hypothetical protein
MGMCDLLKVELLWYVLAPKAFKEKKEKAVEQRKEVIYDDTFMSRYKVNAI